MFKVGASWTIITSTLKRCQYTLTLVFPGKTSGQLRLSATVEVCSRRRLLWIGRNYSSIHRKWPWGANKGWDRCQCCQKLILWRLSLRRTTLMILKKRGNDKESHEQRSKAPPKAKAKVGPWSRFFLATLILQRDELRGRFGHFRLRPPGGCDAAVKVRLLKGVRQQREKRRAAAAHVLFCVVISWNLTLDVSWGCWFSCRSQNFGCDANHLYFLVFFVNRRKKGVSWSTSWQ